LHAVKLIVQHIVVRKGNRSDRDVFDTVAVVEDAGTVDVCSTGDRRIGIDVIGARLQCGCAVAAGH